LRKDVKMHLIFYGMPDPPKHIEIQITPELDISKKDVANLIKKILYKYREGKKHEVLPGCFIEKKSFLKVIEELKEQGNKIYVLDKRGEDIRQKEINKNSIFILGDHEGLPEKELKRLKKIAIPISVGPKMYFASQVVAILNNELDRKGI
jgi:tRNA pseudouridine-54 N-methylase